MLRRKETLKHLIILFMAIAIAPSWASTQEGQVTQLMVRQSDGLHYFFMTGTRSTRPACAQNHTYWMIADENSVAGQAQYAMLLSALVSGRTIVANGTGRCDRWSDGEDLDTLYLK